MKHFQRTTISVAAAHVALCWSAAAMAQAAPANPEPASQDTVVVTGQRKALQSAQQLKRNAEEVVDSIVAEDIGKLPDRSVTEVLQRVVGVSMDRTAARNDPIHYSVEGSGVVIRGLTYVGSQLNGRDTISANGGRALGFEDVPPELMAAVDVYKNPSAEQLEGGISGLVNLRTALPFDFKGFKLSGSLSGTYDELNGQTKPSASVLISNIWNTDLGKFGAMLDVARSDGSTRTDKLVLDPFYYTTTKQADGTYVKDGTGHLFPGAMSWGIQQYDRSREGIYGALQWQRNDMSSALTYFRSKYNISMTESNVQNTPQPYSTVVSNATWGANGQMLTGALTNPSQGGMEVEEATRYNIRNSQTQELAWKFDWKPNARWNLSTDLQYVDSKTIAFDSTVATAVLMPKETIDLTGALPKLSFDAGDAAYMANQSNYYWATTMEHLDQGWAKQKALRADAKYTFEDNPYLSDVRFGVRATERDARTVNSNPGWHWSTVTHAWQQWWDIPNGNLAYVTNYNDPTTVRSFGNFLGGRAALPSLYFPAMSVTQGFPNSYQSLYDHYKQLCSGCWMSGNWAPASFDPNDQTNPGRNDQHERTYTGYAQLRFGFDELKYPVDGNVGVRVVRTEEKANGYTSLTVTTPTGGTTGTFPSLTTFAASQAQDNSYTDVLPSLNLKMKVRDDLQFRFAAAKAISRPPLDKLQAYTTMSLSPKAEGGVVTGYNLNGSANGNPMLKPVQSTQEDLTAEWYFGKSSSLTAAVFNKDLKDIIIDQTFGYTLHDANGQPYTATVTGPTNGANGYARGFEVAYQQFFDALPGWMSGFGMQANYTFVDSKMTRKSGVASDYCSAGNGADNLNLFINGCDTDGRSFRDMPLTNLSRNTFNLALLYEKGPISARIAYSWRERYLYGVALNSDNTGPNQQNGLDSNPASATYGKNNLPIGLPLWAGSYGQVDAGIQYKVNDNLTVNLQGQNLTDAFYKQYMQQHTGMNGHAYFTSGRRYTLSLQYGF